MSRFRRWIGRRKEDDESGTVEKDEGLEDHSELISLLSEQDIAFAMDPRRPEDERVFDFDPSRPSDEVFPQSVASGGPTPTGVILWTRIEPEVYKPDEPLGLEVANDEEFDDLVYRGLIDNSKAIQGHDYTVKADLDGVLEPDTYYYYRFVYDRVASKTGRCHTLPAEDSSPESVSLAVLTCQNYANGYYGAYRHVAEEDVDYIIHVGDFIYESDSEDFKGAGSKDYHGRELELPSGHDRVHEVEDYRYLYKIYKSDQLLQKALEKHTMIAAWDDHEIANDIYWDYEDDAPKADHPRGDDPEFMTNLTTDAIQAWWEYMPARIDYNPEAESLQERFKLWRTFRFGDLIDLVMTDERLFRDEPRDTYLAMRRTVDPDREPEDRTMLGRAQLEWFLDQMKGSEAKWTVWTDEVLTIPLRLGFGPLSFYPVQGGWDGYTRERRKIINELEGSGIENFVTITGDMHCYIAGYQKTDHTEPVSVRRFLRGDSSEHRMGVEFMTPAMTSVNIAEALGVNRWPISKITEPLISWLVRLFNPHIKYFNSHHNGYSTVKFTRDECIYKSYKVDKTVPGGEAEREPMKWMRVPEGKPELQDITRKQNTAGKQK